MPIYKAAYLAPPLAKRGGGVEYLLAVGGCKLHVYTLGDLSLDDCIYAQNVWAHPYYEVIRVIDPFHGDV